MRALLSLTVAAAFADIGLGQSPTPKTEQYYVDLLRWVDHADVNADFHRNVTEKHDTRFIAVNGISGNMVLGASSAIVHKHGFWLIEGTGDAGHGPEDSRLNMKAVNYARQYNAMLEKYLDSRSAR